MMQEAWLIYLIRWMWIIYLRWTFDVFEVKCWFRNIGLLNSVIILVCFNRLKSLNFPEFNCCFNVTEILTSVTLLLQCIWRYLVLYKSKKWVKFPCGQDPRPHGHMVSNFLIQIGLNPIRNLVSLSNKYLSIKKRNTYIKNNIVQMKP